FFRNGELFFPLGFFNLIDAETVDALAGTPFTTLLSYTPPDDAAMDRAAAAGISVIYSLKDFFYDSSQGAKPDEIHDEEDEVPVIIDHVERYRDHPALLAWYMADEPYEVEYDRMETDYLAVAGPAPKPAAY